MPLPRPRCGFIYALTRYAFEMIQHAGARAGARGSAFAGLFTSGAGILQVRGSVGGHILRIGARQQRGTLVHAVGGHVVLRGAPGRSREGSRLQWLAVPSWSGPADSVDDGGLRGEEPRAVPAPLKLLRAWAVLWSCLKTSQEMPLQ